MSTNDIDFQAISEESLELLAKHGNLPMICIEAKAELERRGARAAVDALLLRIAQACNPNIETLEEQKRDNLDFHQVFVTSFRTALRQAYDAGRGSAEANALAKQYRERYCDLVDEVRAAVKAEAPAECLRELVFTEGEGE